MSNPGTDLGFGKSRKALDGGAARAGLESAAAMKPVPIQEPDLPAAKIRQIAAKQPETIVQSSGAVLRKRGNKGATVPLNMRVPIDTQRAICVVLRHQGSLQAVACGNQCPQQRCSPRPLSP